MKSKRLLFTTTIFVGILTYILTSSSSGGVTGKSSVGCGGGSCHAQNAATTISVTGIPTTGYTAGNTYTVTVNVQNTTKVSAGFNLEVSDGTISNAPSGTNTASANSELFHTTPKPLSVSGASWTFNWTAPAAGGAIIINVAGNAVNATGSSGGDAYATASFNYTSIVTVLAPTIVSQNVSTIGITNVIINAMVNANNANTSINVEYGLTTAYGTTIATTPPMVSGSVASAVSATLNSLLPNTTYHYRINATNSVGTTNGPDSIFTTKPNSIEEITSGNFKIYPNPSSDNLYITTETTFSSIAFYISDLQGNRIALSYEKIKQDTYKLSLLSLAAGSYIVQIHTNNARYQSTFIKTN